MNFSEMLKVKVRKKAHLRCCLCKSIGVEVHHIIPQKEGGLDTEDNAAPLCPSCHETYGSNPQKRKFIREARDFWYEICENRYSSDSDKLEELKKMVQNTVSYDDFKKFKEEILTRLNLELQNPRTEDEIFGAIGELFDKIWFDRHQILNTQVESGEREEDAEIWKDAQKAAKKIESRYPKKELGPWDDFEWGMINGKLSALRWVMGDEWDMLDT